VSTLPAARRSLGKSKVNQCFALVAGLFGFGGVASTAAGIAQILFFLFVVFFVVALVAGLMRRGRP
jgi:uncharacterized membrane protein YtjA (UPF0391 family)